MNLDNALKLDVLTITVPKAALKLSWDQWTPNTQVHDYLYQLKAELKNLRIETIDFYITKNKGIFPGTVDIDVIALFRDTNAHEQASKVIQPQLFNFA